MKLRHTNQIELSMANLRALLADAEKAERQGRTVSALIYKTTSDGVVAVSVVSDDEHYSDEELAKRKSPYLAPEAWAGVL